MNKTLAVYMSIAGTMLILVSLIMGIVYAKAETTSQHYQSHMVNFQTSTK